MAQERLNKVMANAGIASRRACDEMIQAGRVTVNGKVVTQLGVKVDPERDQIRVDGEAIKARAPARRSYLMLYKPAGILSVFDDPRGRPGLDSLLKGPVRLYPVGRLDLDSEGLLLLTDDGDLTLKLSHPRFEHPKSYLVLVDRVPGSDTLARFRRGIQLDDGVTAPSQWRVLEHPAVLPPPADPSAAEGVWLHVTMHEGRKRQIRRMAAAENLQVRRLVRVAMGSLRLDRKLKPGESRALTRREMEQLLEDVKAAQLPAAPRRAARPTVPAGRPRPDRSPARSAHSHNPARPTGQRPADAGERQPARRGPSAGAPRLADDAERQRAPYAGAGRPGSRPAGARPPQRRETARRSDQPERAPDRHAPYQRNDRPAPAARGPRAQGRPDATWRDDEDSRDRIPRTPRRTSSTGGPRPGGGRPPGGAGPRAQGRPDATWRDDEDSRDRTPRTPRRTPSTGGPRPGGGRPPGGAGPRPRRPGESVSRRPGGRPSRPPQSGSRKPRKP